MALQAPIYLVHLCYQKGPGASCTPSSLHPCTPFWQLSTWMGYPHSLLAWIPVPLVWALCLRPWHGRTSAWKHAEALRVRACVLVCRHASVASVLCLLLCIDDKWGKGLFQWGRGEESCASEVAPFVISMDAMPKLQFAAPGAACTHSLALSSSYCIWSRLCALLAQLAHHSSRHG